MKKIPFAAIDKNKFINLPASEHQKVLIFDMDETLIHCVEDIETQTPEVVLEINFPDEEPVYAGINIRPFMLECLK